MSPGSNVVFATLPAAEGPQTRMPIFLTHILAAFVPRGVLINNQTTASMAVKVRLQVAFTLHQRRQLHRVRTSLPYLVYQERPSPVSCADFDDLGRSVLTWTAGAACFRFLVTPYIKALTNMSDERALYAKVAVTPVCFTQRC